MPAVAYNPSDPTQQSFLSALALGETGGAKNGYSLGVGGTDLSGASHDQYGFPVWGGFGNSHAAGEFQFQPGTWDTVAAQHNLNFGNPADQNAAAWYLAQDTYAQKTGGDLTTALQKGDFGSVQAALADVWPSVTGNAAAPGGLAATLGGGGGAELLGGSAPSPDTSGGVGGIAGWISNEFARFGVLIVGSIVVFVALWWLLSERGVVPSPGDTAKAVGKGVAAAAVA